MRKRQVYESWAATGADTLKAVDAIWRTEPDDRELSPKRMISNFRGATNPNTYWHASSIVKREVFDDCSNF